MSGVTLADWKAAGMQPGVMDVLMVMNGSTPGALTWKIEEWMECREQVVGLGG